MKKKVVAIIPSRMGSSRFPGKPLTSILGLSMIEHVRRRAELIDILDEIYVATCDQEIKEEVEKHGGKVIMTSSSHERCTDRIEEAAHKIDADIVVNIQGDEPMVASEAIEEVVRPFLESDEDIDTTCLIYPIKVSSELSSDNIVKCVLSRSEKILYLSRASIPGRSSFGETQFYKQSGIMAFTKDFLHKFSTLESTPLEQREGVDMLRVLEHDYSIHGVVSEYETKGVDVPEQVEMVEKEIMGDPVHKELFLRIKDNDSK